MMNRYVFILMLGLAAWTSNGADAQNRSPQKLEYDNQYEHASHQTIQINGERLGKCFYLEALRFRSVSFTRVDDLYPELGTYLAGSKAVDYFTGNESALRSKILEADPGTVDPVHLFLWSMKLNQGRVFEAILTIHELLRNEARFYRDWVHYPSNRNQMHYFFNQFIDIRGDLEERGPGFHGDHRGSWYRIWGTMLDYLQMVMPNRDRAGKIRFVYQSASWRTYANWAGSMTSHLAEWAKPILFYGHESDPRKAEINQKGYDSAKAMIDMAFLPPLDAESIHRWLRRCEEPSFYLNSK